MDIILLQLGLCVDVIQPSDPVTSYQEATTACTVDTSRRLHGPELVQEIPRVLPCLPSTRRWPLSSARRIQSITFHKSSLGSILTFFYALAFHLVSCLQVFQFKHCVHYLACNSPRPSHLRLDHRLLFGKEYKSASIFRVQASEYGDNMYGVP